MGKYWQSVLIIGLFLLAITVMLLLYHPQPETEGTYVCIDTDLYKTSLYATFVKTTVDLGQQEHLDNFPKRIGEWQGIDRDASSAVKEVLEADVLLLRTYSKAKLYQPIFLLIMQGPSQSSFHPPPMCYKSLGYKIEEEEEDKLFVKDTSWVGQINKQELTQISPTMPARARQELEFDPYRGQISVRKLVVFKENSNREIIERRVVLYFYIEDVAMTSDKIGMIRVSALIPTSGPYDDTLRIAKEFMGEVIPLIFEPPEETRMVITSLVEWGIGGYFIILLIFSIPLAMIVYPVVVARRSGRSATIAEPTGERTKNKEKIEEADEGKPRRAETSTLPLRQTHDLVSGNGRVRILRAYYNSLKTIEKTTDISAESYATLREFLKDVTPALPSATVNSLHELTKIAEAAIYSTLQPDENIVLRAEQLADVIIKELDSTIT